MTLKDALQMLTTAEGFASCLQAGSAAVRNLSENVDGTICLRCDVTDWRVAKIIVKATLRAAEAYVAVGNVGRVTAAVAACSCLVTLVACAGISASE